MLMISDRNPVTQTAFCRHAVDIQDSFFSHFLPVLVGWDGIGGWGFVFLICVSGRVGGGVGVGLGYLRGGGWGVGGWFAAGGVFGGNFRRPRGGALS